MHDEPGGDARPSDPRLLDEQRRLTFINLTLLMLLGTGGTVLALAGILPVVVAWPTPARWLLEGAGYVLLFDAYFYFTHRLLHAPLPFRLVHAVHHRARVLTVWSTIAMHPLEFVLLAGFLPVAMAVWPIHLASVLSVAAFLAASITLAHSGRDPFPRWWSRVPLLDLHLTPPVHEAHHLRSSGNYGATTTLLDRLFGTLHRR
jgi:sterol desaturase/sphingolipid hydroxylase (fatty acid hydroxylase superfamily)